MIRAIAVCAALLTLAGCSATQIARDCLVAEPAADIALIAVPGGGLINLAVDVACADPATTARVLKDGEAVAERLRDQR